MGTCDVRYQRRRARRLHKIKPSINQLLYQLLYFLNIEHYFLQLLLLWHRKLAHRLGTISGDTFFSLKVCCDSFQIIVKLHTFARWKGRLLLAVDMVLIPCLFFLFYFLYFLIKVRYKFLSFVKLVIFLNSFFICLKFRYAAFAL